MKLNIQHSLAGQCCDVWRQKRCLDRTVWTMQSNEWLAGINVHSEGRATDNFFNSGSLVDQRRKCKDSKWFHPQPDFIYNPSSIWLAPCTQYTMVDLPQPESDSFRNGLTSFDTSGSYGGEESAAFDRLWRLI